MSGHGIDVCACGTVIAQCKCMDHDERRVVCQTCAKCSAPRTVKGSTVGLAEHESHESPAAVAPRFTVAR